MGDKRTTLGERLLLVSGYSAFFLLCFLLFAYWTFPYDRVRDVIVQRAEAASPGSTVEIGELGPYWLSGVTLTDVKVEGPTAQGEQPNGIALDELTLSVSPFALAFGTTDVGFTAQLGEGEIDGSYNTSEDGPTSLVVELDSVELGNLGLASYVKVPIKGTATGLVDVTLAAKPDGTKGDVDIQVADFTVGDGKSKVPMPGGWGGVTVPAIGLGTLALKITIKEGIATIEKLEAKGKDVSLSGSGAVRMLQPFSLSRADLTLGVRVDDAFAKREPKIKTVMAMPQVKNNLGSDGMIRFGLTGTISNLKAKQGAAAGSSKGARPSRRSRRTGK